MNEYIKKLEQEYGILEGDIVYGADFATYENYRVTEKNAHFIYRFMNKSIFKTKEEAEKFHDIEAAKYFAWLSS